jgi:hypothetical protein
LTADTTRYLERIAANVFDNPINSMHLAAFVTDPHHVTVVA